jgi:hypothetical protein
MRLPLVVTQQLGAGTTNPIVARLTVQTLEILQQCALTKEKADEIGAIYLNSLVKKLLRCAEIEERLKGDANRKRAGYKPPGRGAVSVELPQILQLEEECHNFLYEAKNFLRDLVRVFSLLYGTKFEDASEWIPPTKGGGDSVMAFAAKTFGEDHVNTTYFRQLPTCIAPFIYMRNAVEHPKGYSGELKITNFAFGADGKLTDPVWSREKDGNIEYGPLPIIEDMHVAVHNLLLLAEDILIMWARANLVAPSLMEVTVVPESKRNPLCPIKHRIGPSAALLGDIARVEPVGAKARTNKSG